MNDGQLLNRNYVVCTECGRTVHVYNKSHYTYKTPLGYQCSYTCYDHAILRKSGDRGASKSVTLRRLKDCEKVMKGQGKKVLHPCDKNE